MIEFLDRRAQREHLENLMRRKTLSEAQRDFIIFNKIRENETDYDALEAQEWIDWAAEQTLLEAENAGY